MINHYAQSKYTISRQIMHCVVILSSLDKLQKRIKEYCE